MSLTELLDGEVSGGDAIPDLDLEPSPLTSARRLAGSGSPLTSSWYLRWELISYSSVTF